MSIFCLARAEPALNEVERAGIRGVKIGKISTFFQPKVMIPKSKNQIFQKFLTHFPKTSYERRATRNGYIFVSNVQLRLIIEALLFRLHSIFYAGQQFLPFLTACKL
jgi:hypothetical protein